MRRRGFIAGILGVPAFARGQTAAPNHVHRLGALVFTSTSLDLIRAVVMPGLARLGFEGGRNLVLDARLGAPGDMHRLASDLVRSHPHAILAVGNAAAAAAKAATTTIPIVFFGSDPVELGWAESLARPASNMTGLLMLGPELDAKRLQLLRQTVPDASRLAAMIQPASPNAEARRQAIHAASRDLGVDVAVLDATGPRDYPTIFAALRATGAKGLLVGSDPIFLRDIDAIIRMSDEAGLASICHWREMAQRGCLMSYGPRLSDMYYRTAEILARIFSGVQPSDLPIENPTRFEFIVNLRAARSLNLRVPEPVLIEADEVIE